MAITGLPSFAVREVPTATKMNTFMSTITTKFASNISTADLKWPLVCGNDIDLNGNALLNVPVVGMRRNLTNRKQWATVNAVFKEVEFFGGGMVYQEANSTLTPDVTSDEYGVKVAHFKIGSNTMLLGGGYSSEMAGILAEDKENVYIRDMLFSGRVMVYTSKNVVFEDCFFKANSTIDIRDSDVAFRRCQLATTTYTALDSEVQFDNNTVYESTIAHYQSKSSTLGRASYSYNSFFGNSVQATFTFAGLERNQWINNSLTTYKQVSSGHLVTIGNTWNGKGAIYNYGTMHARILRNLFVGTNNVATVIDVDSREDSSGNDARGVLVMGNVISGTQNDNGVVVGTNMPDAPRPATLANNVVNVPDSALYQWVRNVGAPVQTKFPTNSKVHDQSRAIVIGNTLMGGDATEAAYHLRGGPEMLMHVIVGNNCQGGTTLGGGGLGMETSDVNDTPDTAFGYDASYDIWAVLAGNNCSGLEVAAHPTPATTTDFNHGVSYVKIVVLSTVDDSTQINNY